MEIGEQTSFALMVMLDVMFPEKISVGRNTVIGYNTTILAHEYLIKEYRLGNVEIGSEVMIGANTTILPGVNIGDGAIVSAGTLVHKDVPPGAFVGGNPMRIIYTKEELADRWNDDEIYGTAKPERNDVLSGFFLMMCLLGFVYTNGRPIPIEVVGYLFE